MKGNKLIYVLSIIAFALAVAQGLLYWIIGIETFPSWYIFAGDLVLIVLVMIVQKFAKW